MIIVTLITMITTLVIIRETTDFRFDFDSRLIAVADETMATTLK